MTIILIYVLLVVLVNAAIALLVGMHRKIGFLWSFFFCCLLSPVIGLLITILKEDYFKQHIFLMRAAAIVCMFGSIGLVLMGINVNARMMLLLIPGAGLIGGCVYIITHFNLLGPDDDYFKNDM